MFLSSFSETVAFFLGKTSLISEDKGLYVAGKNAKLKIKTKQDYFFLEEV